MIKLQNTMLARATGDTVPRHYGPFSRWKTSDVSLNKSKLNRNNANDSLSLSHTLTAHNFLRRERAGALSIRLNLDLEISSFLFQRWSCCCYRAQSKLDPWAVNLPPRERRSRIRRSRFFLPILCSRRLVQLLFCARASTLVSRFFREHWN